MGRRQRNRIRSEGADDKRLGIVGSFGAHSAPMITYSTGCRPWQLTDVLFEDYPSCDWPKCN